MAVVQTSYPVTSSVVMTFAIASLAADAGLVIGRASTAVDNRTNLDLDHLVSGIITTGTTPTAGSVIELWAYAPIKTVTGTPTYPDSITGTDAAKTMTSLNVKYAALVPVQTFIIDATSNITFPIRQFSIATLFGTMPKFWGLFLVQATGVALNATAGNQDFEYERIQATVV